MDRRELKIVETLIAQGVAHGGHVVVGGEDDELYEGQDVGLALKDAQAVEVTWLYFYDANYKERGAFLIVWGNGDDIISDMSDSAWCDEVFNKVSATFGLI